LVGYSGRGLPEVLDAGERDVADDADRVRETVAALARQRFAVPLVTGGPDVSEMLTGPEPPPGATAALAETRVPLLAVCGMATLLPGAHARPLASIDVPVLAAVGEYDIVGRPEELPGYFPASPGVSVEVIPGAYHNSNVAPGRQLLWDRIARWAQAL
jgi:pimeloyl-ACP methyl ester carboxylesterase